MKNHTTISQQSSFSHFSTLYKMALKLTVQPNNTNSLSQNDNKNCWVAIDVT